MAKTRKTKARANFNFPAITSPTASTSESLLKEQLLERMQTFYEEEENRRLSVYKELPFAATRSICWKTLKDLTIDDEIQKLLNQGGLDLFAAVEEPAYKELTIEFLCTFTHNEKITNPNNMRKYSFSVMGRGLSLTLNDLNRYLGAVTQETLSSDEYKQSLTSFPEDFDAVKFWEEITGLTNYSSSECNASNLREYSHRVLQKLIAGTIFARVNQSHVPTLDLFALWCMVKGRRMNVGAWFGDYIASLPSKAAGKIMCGSYVTKITKSAGFFNATHLTFQCEPTPIDINCLKQIGVAKKFGKTWYLHSVAEEKESALKAAKEGKKVVKVESEPAPKKRKYTEEDQPDDSLNIPSPAPTPLNDAEKNSPFTSDVPRFLWKPWYCGLIICGQREMMTPCRWKKCRRGFSSLKQRSRN